MSHLITIQTRDDQQITFDCEKDQNLLSAAETAGYFLPAICKEGSCGACLGHCRSGDYRLDHYSESALSSDAADRGDVLLCQTYAQSPLNLTVPYDFARIAQHRPSIRTAEIASIQNIAARTVKLTLQLQDDPALGLAFDFEPGQYVELELPELDLKRAYSLANTTNWEGRLEFLIRLQAGGRFSAFLQQANSGQQLLVHGPTGAFGIEAQSLRPRCMIAGGTGLAPFLSILKRMAEWGDDHPTRLFLGVNNEEEILCLEELQSLQQNMSQLHVDVCVWKPETNWPGFTGTPADALQGYLTTCDQLPDIYLCGPPPMVESATSVALAAGVPSEQIYSERFTAN